MSKLTTNFTPVAWLVMGSQGHYAEFDNEHGGIPLYTQEQVLPIIRRAEHLDAMLTESVQALKAAEQRIAELEKRLINREAQPVGESDYIRRDCGCCGFETLNDYDFHDGSVCPKCNHRPLGKTELYTAPPAVAAELNYNRRRIAELEDMLDTQSAPIQSSGTQPAVWVMSDDLTDDTIISTPAYTNKSEAEARTIGALTPLYTATTVASGENCWTCGKFFTYEQHSECDGYCPHCDAPVDLDEGREGSAPLAPLDAQPVEWSGWACQFPGHMPRLYGDRAIAEINCDYDGGARLLFLSSVPPAPAVPTEKAPNDFLFRTNANYQAAVYVAEGWNACRAAMLAIELGEKE
ncbi:hypothetical protein [Serratia marcescens]|uniref:hypothetical protein n=1 Tax=Serratia marcescens TaxID=615 RepID=UPI00217C7C22|nr:hypothetical protein [Serratia marcescens]CAI1970305.1 Uncharacterised protein [Serratia marcescens]